FLVVERHTRFPSPLAGEGGRSEWNEDRPGEGCVRNHCLEIRTPHPPRGLRPLGTLSHKGRGKARPVLGFRNNRYPPSITITSASGFSANSRSTAAARCASARRWLI